MSLDLIVIDSLAVYACFLINLNISRDILEEIKSPPKWFFFSFFYNLTKKRSLSVNSPSDFDGLSYVKNKFFYKRSNSSRDYEIKNHEYEGPKIKLT